MELFIWSSIFIVSLAALIIASRYFTQSAEKLGLMLGISPFIIGVTIVSIGTSLPELISSVFAVVENASEMVAGNVVGSNVVNIFLILGVGAIVGGRLHIDFDLLHVDLPLLLGSAFFIVITLMDKIFTPFEAVLSLVGLVIFVGYTISSAHKERVANNTTREPFRLLPIIILIVSCFFVYLGAKYTVQSVIRLSELLNTGTEIVAITAVALGTSLPELAVTIAAAREGKGELVVGNVLGSNIFNTFAVMGIPGLIGSLSITQTIQWTGLPFLIIASILFFVTTQDKQVSRWEGAMFILFYGLFIAKILNFSWG
ncbi:MAG: sodium:calcium antiporter [Calditrichaeota bacterium]|nr:MAG: sodium:calcium antiporter [Calditrichota bacterium]